MYHYVCNVVSFTIHRRDEMDAETAFTNISQARDSGVFLTARSLDFIMINDPSRRAEYVQEMKGVQYAQQTLITCLETLKRDSDDHDGVTLCVVGTESGHVYILPPDCSRSTVLCKVSIGAVPVLMCPSGRFDVEWRCENRACTVHAMVPSTLLCYFLQSYGGLSRR